MDFVTVIREALLLDLPRLLHDEANTVATRALAGLPRERCVQSLPKYNCCKYHIVRLFFLTCSLYSQSATVCRLSSVGSTLYVYGILA